MNRRYKKPVPKKRRSSTFNSSPSAQPDSRPEAASLDNKIDSKFRPPPPKESKNPASELPDERAMKADDIVRDVELLSVLAAADRARIQCLAILDILESQVHSPSSQPSSIPTTALDEKLGTERKVLLSHLGKVRGLNRKAILNVRKTKQETADAKQEVDGLHLGLQNLKYEQSHLRRQIAICEGFDHPYQSLPLLPTTEFLSLNPQHADLNEHDLMLVRIQYEHDEREAAKKKQMGLLKRKEELMHENSKRKAEMDKLDGKLEESIKGTKALEEMFQRTSSVVGGKE